MTDFALYLDDAGHPDDQPYLVVAGYLANEAQWLAFETAWQKALTRFRLGNAFHMTDFMRYRYSAIKRDQILLALCNAINRNGLRPFVWAIDVAAWRQVNEEFALEECHGAPFAIAARGIQKELFQWRSKNLTTEDRILVFIEEGTKHYGQMEQLFKRDGIPLPVRVPKSMPSVQASDMLAWEIFNWMKRGKARIIGKNLKRLIQPVRNEQGLGSVFHEADLRTLCTETGVLSRSKLRPGDSIVFSSEKKRLRKRTL